MTEPHWTDPGLAIRIFRWADAPAHLQELVSGAVDPAWLAWVPSTKRNEAEGDFGWVDVTRADDPSGHLVVAGREVVIE